MSEKNIPCAVVQDLMPLVIDGAASEESSQAVSKHVSECSVCSKIYSEMQSAVPAPVASEKAEQGFHQAFKHQRKRFRTWKIAVLCLSLVLVICLGIVTLNPSVLLGITQDVPIAWVQNPQLVRTSQGALLIQFTPSSQYKRHYGYHSLQYNALGTNELIFRWDYPWIEKLLGRTLDESDRLLTSPVLKTEDGQWTDLQTLKDYRYVDGQFYEMALEPMTASDFKQLEEKGIDAEGYTAIWRQYNAAGQIDILYMQEGGKKLCIYDAKNGEVPLCSDETQAAFDAFIADNPGFYQWEGELEKSSNANGFAYSENE